MSAAIEVLAIKRLAGEGAIRAFCDIRLGGVTILGVKVIKVGTQKPWVALPQIPARAKADGSGGAGWFPVITLILP